MIIIQSFKKINGKVFILPWNNRKQEEIKINSIKYKDLMIINSW